MNLRVCREMQGILRLIEIQRRDLEILTKRAREMQKEFRKVARLLAEEEDIERDPTLTGIGEGD